MPVVWRGFGCLGIIIPLATVLILSSIWEGPEWVNSAGYIVGGILVWIIGRIINSGESEEMPQEEQKDVQITSASHTLFWIRLEYFSLVLFFLGLSLLLPKQIADFLLMIFIFVAVFYVLIMLILTVYANSFLARKIMSIIQRIIRSSSKTKDQTPSVINNKGLELSRAELDDIKNAKLQEIAPSDPNRFMPEKVQANSPTLPTLNEEE